MVRVQPGESGKALETALFCFLNGDRECVLHEFLHEFQFRPPASSSRSCDRSRTCFTQSSPRGGGKGGRHAGPAQRAFAAFDPVPPRDAPLVPVVRPISACTSHPHAMQ